MIPVRVRRWGGQLLRGKAAVERLIALVVAVVLLALLGPGRALAQEATPAAGAFPITPDPTECQVEPRSVEAFQAIRAETTPTAVAALATAVEVPLGQAADAEIVAGVITTVREALACGAAGDVHRVYSLYSEDAIRMVPEVVMDAILTWTPEAVPAEERVTLLAVTDVMALGDGRVGAFLVRTHPVSGPDTIYVTFVNEDGRWLVDDLVHFLLPEGMG